MNLKLILIKDFFHIIKNYNKNYNILLKKIKYEFKL